MSRGGACAIAVATRPQGAPLTGLPRGATQSEADEAPRARWGVSDLVGRQEELVAMGYCNIASWRPDVVLHERSDKREDVENERSMVLPDSASELRGYRKGHSQEPRVRLARVF